MSKTVKAKTMKFFNAVRVGTTQLTYIDPQNTKVVAEITGNIVKITDTKENVTYTSLYNVPYWTIEEQHEPTRNAGPNKGSRAKKGK